MASRIMYCEKHKGSTTVPEGCPRCREEARRRGLLAPDMVNHPPHYKLFPDMEALDVIKAALSVEEFRGYLKGCVLKYRLRAGMKNDASEDLDKARWYCDRLFDEDGV